MSDASRPIYEETQDMTLDLGPWEGHREDEAHQQIASSQVSAQDKPNTQIKLELETNETLSKKKTG